MPERISGEASEPAREPADRLIPQTRPTLAVGDQGRFTKTMTENDVFAFAEASGDFNPLHVDQEYAHRSIFKRRVVHGILTSGVISTVLGGEIPGLGTIFTELNIRFLKPVYFNDTITATATVMEIINPQRVRLLVACVNQHGHDVAIGNAVVVPPRETRLIGYELDEPDEPPVGHDADATARERVEGKQTP